MHGYHIITCMKKNPNKLVFVSCSLKSTARHICMFSGFVKVGGYNGLWESYGQSMGKPYTPVNATASNETDLSSCFKLTPYWDHMFRPLNDPDYPWLGLWTTLPIMGIWYWCTDQVGFTQSGSCTCTRNNFLKGSI